MRVNALKSVLTAIFEMDKQIPPEFKVSDGILGVQVV